MILLHFVRLCDLTFFFFFFFSLFFVLFLSIHSFFLSFVRSFFIYYSSFLFFSYFLFLLKLNFLKNLIDGVHGLKTEISILRIDQSGARPLQGGKPDRFSWKWRVTRYSQSTESGATSVHGTPAKFPADFPYRK